MSDIQPVRASFHWWNDEFLSPVYPDFDAIRKVDA